MDVGQPIRDVVPGARGMMLATLVQLEKPVTVRALARHSGVAAQTALNLVDELSQVGLVRTQRMGGLIMVALNRDHILAEPLCALASTRRRLIERLTEELVNWRGLAAAWLFGSAARGDGDRLSDIDLLLVAKADTGSAEWGSNIATLGAQVQEWTGNPAQITEHTWESFERLARDGSVLISAIRSDGIPLTPGSRSRLRDVA